MKREFKLVGKGIDSLLPIGKVNCIKLTNKEFIYLEKMDDGTWRFSYTEKTIPNVQDLASIEIIRED